MAAPRQRQQITRRSANHLLGEQHKHAPHACCKQPYAARLIAATNANTQNCAAPLASSAHVCTLQPGVKSRGMKKGGGGDVPSASCSCTAATPLTLLANTGGARTPSNKRHGKTCCSLLWAVPAPTRQAGGGGGGGGGEGQRANVEGPCVYGVKHIKRRIRAFMNASWRCATASCEPI